VGEPVERRFLIVAGEASGDLHASRLVSELRSLGPCRVRGVTGPSLEAAGAEREVAMEELAVIGFSAVVPRLPRIWRAYRRLLALYDEMKPDACVLVDSPGFNFRLGPALRRRGARVFYYIAPQVWAWHAGRARAMARWVDRMAVVFPFEEALFRDAGVDATFVGHPLLDDLAPEVDARALRGELGLRGEQRIVGLLPGSRRQEVRQHAATLVEAARALSRGRPDLAFVVALAAGAGEERTRSELLARWRAAGQPGEGASGATLHVIAGRTRSVQAHAAACAVASGTATLETALFGTPLAIVYRVGALNYAIARRVIRLERIGLPNIVAGHDVAPELLQGDFTADRLAATLAPWLDDAAANAAARAGLAAVRARLGSAGASRRAAELAWALASA
jgi:lipid-A-disaccharide synthase